MLALIAALQYIPARQHAVLILRAVLRRRAAEAADLAARGYSRAARLRPGIPDRRGAWCCAASAACPALAVRIGASPPVAGVVEKVRHGPGHRAERELEILCLVAAGVSNGQVASAMYISGHTVAGSLRSMPSRTKPATGPGWPAAPRRPGFARPHLATAG